MSFHNIICHEEAVWNISLQEKDLSHDLMYCRFQLCVLKHVRQILISSTNCSLGTCIAVYIYGLSQINNFKYVVIKNDSINNSETYLRLITKLFRSRLFSYHAHPSNILVKIQEHICPCWHKQVKSRRALVA